jgi:hypothetical protein
MGNEAACKLRYEGKTFSGKALLEMSEILFRGERCLKIPFPAITKLQARDGELHIQTKEGSAVFAIGAQAEKWRKKIAKPKTLIEKLGVKAGQTVSLIGEFPADFVASLKKHGATIRQNKGTTDAAWHFLAAESKPNLQRVKGVARGLKGGAGLWIVYPKGQTAITESDVRSSGLSAGLTDSKVASFSPTHTSLKFVVPKS